MDATPSPTESIAMLGHASGTNGNDPLREPLDGVVPAFRPALPERRARVTWAATITPEQVTWAWRDEQGHERIAAGTLSVAAGREGTGKSSFGIHLAAQITRGRLPGSWTGTPRRVLYVAVEDSWKHTLVPRLIAAGADLGLVGKFDVVGRSEDHLALTLPHDNELLETQIRDLDVALVVIDPLMSAIAERIDTHRERDVRTALDPLAALAERTGAVLLGIAHFSKGSSTDAASLITGSGAFKNVPRSIFGFARLDDRGERRVMTQVKNSLGRDELPSLAYVIEAAEVETPTGGTSTGHFRFVGETDQSVGDVLREQAVATEDRHEAAEAVTWLRAFLTAAGGEATAKEVFSAARRDGFSDDQVKRAKRRAGAISAKSGGGNKPWIWQLTPSQPVAATE